MGVWWDLLNGVARQDSTRIYNSLELLLRCVSCIHVNVIKSFYI